MGCFFIYLEEVFREIRRETELDIIHPNEIMYADDVIFISMEKHKDADKIHYVLHRHYLKVNTDKIQYTTIKIDLDDWKKSNKVRSLLGDKDDNQRRKNQARTSSTD